MPKEVVYGSRGAVDRGRGAIYTIVALESELAILPPLTGLRVFFRKKTQR